MARNRRRAAGWVGWSLPAAGPAAAPGRHRIAPGCCPSGRLAAYRSPRPAAARRESRGEALIAVLDRMGRVAQQMRQAHLTGCAMAQLAAVAIGHPDRRTRAVGEGGDARASSGRVRPNTSASNRARRSKPIAWVTCRWMISAHNPGPNGEPGANSSGPRTATRLRQQGQTPRWRFQLHRGLVQPGPPSFQPGLTLADGIRSSRNGGGRNTGIATNTPPERGDFNLNHPLRLCGARARLRRNPHPPGGPVIRTRHQGASAAVGDIDARTRPRHRQSGWAARPDLGAVRRRRLEGGHRPRPGPAGTVLTSRWQPACMCAAPSSTII